MDGNSLKQVNTGSGHRVLLCLLPFWTPLIPPQGMAFLKSFIEANSDIPVRAVDFNVTERFRELYNSYFDTLKSFIPEHKRGNFYNMGHDALQNHMMAHFRHTDRDAYHALVKEVMYQNYFYQISDEQVAALNAILDQVFMEIDEYLLALIEEVKPTVVGFTAYNHTFPAAVYCFKLIKERFPEIKTAMGGGVFIWQITQGTEDFDYFLEETRDYIDKIFIGTGQMLFLKYLLGELPPEQRIFTPADLDEPLPYSQVTPPDFSDYELDYYPYLVASASTSCPYKCSFCSINVYYGDYQMKEASQTVKEIANLYSQYKRQMFFMIDSLLNPVADGLAEELIKSGMPIYWDGYFRVSKESADIEKTLFWRRGGFYRARIGVESGSQRVLDLMGKGITVDESRAALSALAYAGIKTTTFWVIGHPGETEEDFQMTLDLLEELKDDIYEAEYNPFFYFYTNQAHTDQWASMAIPLYPNSAWPMLISRTWVLDCYPDREVVFERLNRFEQHRKKLGIPNPYTLEEIYRADARWKKLHKNAAPSLIDFENGKQIDDRQNVKKLIVAKESSLEDASFNF